MRIAFATCDVFPDGRPDDQLAAAMVGAEFRVWNAPETDWFAYDRVVIRSVWDCYEDLRAFLGWCATVGAERLRNRPKLVAFNADKRYLATLAIPTVPTAYLGPGGDLVPYEAEIVVKPNTSAGARDTGRFMPDAFGDAAALVTLIHATGRTALVQPYLPSVDMHGETSVVLFGGEVSHILKKRPVLRTAGVAPRAAGGFAQAPAAVMFEDDLVGPGEATTDQLELAYAAYGEIAARFGDPLYMRVDMVPGADGAPVVMELEMIEPNLYLDLVPGAAERFAHAVRASR
jgi:hypothetical protein